MNDVSRDFNTFHHEVSYLHLGVKIFSCGCVKCIVPDLKVLV